VGTSHPSRTGGRRYPLAAHRTTRGSERPPSAVPGEPV